MMQLYAIGKLPVASVWPSIELTAMTISTGVEVLSLAEQQQ